MLYVMFFFCLLLSFIITPLVKTMALKIGVVDRPNYRKVHQELTPLLGGLAIYICFMLGVLIVMPNSPFIWPILIGATIITLTGVIDDMVELRVKWKFFGQSIAACSVVFGGIYIENIDFPFIGTLELSLYGIPLTFLWIIVVTNAINLIDGLDGLAAGVSSIVLGAITFIAIMDGNLFIVALTLLLLGSTLGFLVHNFHPAKIFMGDTGSLFLGFMISVISILGFKSITLFTLLVPIIILAVPLSDSLFAIVRRIVNRKPISSPDKSHLHHRLLHLGFSHRMTVLLLYGLSAFFAFCALLLTKSTLFGGLVIMVVVIITIQLVVETVGLIHNRYRPMLNFFNRITNFRKTPYEVSKQKKDWF